MFVLGLVATANAAIDTFNAPLQPPCIHGMFPPDLDVLPGQIVWVTVTANANVTSAYMVSIMETTTSAAGHSMALALGNLHAGFDLLHNNGNLRNMMTNTPSTSVQRYILIDRIAGNINKVGGSPLIPAGQILYQFELKIPDQAMLSDLFTITCAYGNTAIGAPPYSHSLDGVNMLANSVALVLHVIPEPVTIALLGLGGLFLRRRR